MKKIKKIFTSLGAGTLLSATVFGVAASCSSQEKSGDKNQNDTMNSNKATMMTDKNMSGSQTENMESNKTTDDMSKMSENNLMRNIDIDFTKYGIQKFSGQQNVRRLLHPADKSNRLDANGIFNIKLHLSPVKGVTGEWIAFATEVKSENDNTLVKPLNIKYVSTIAQTDQEFPLVWKFDGDQKLQDGKFYTFVFIKKDGSDIIMFSEQNIQTSRDVFPAQLPTNR
ncbi:hypothetical protein [Mycoplasma leonicaptivi]|uniref:hypothetical protein n=1 Tax=Mycoplasma leonicaptivi TaxID=36742 RepID=UPI000687B77D|nr:hypothetical protein [Mycoplasma leonicaptivi]